MIPKGIDKIADNAFQNCKLLEHIYVNSNDLGDINQILSFLYYFFLGKQYGGFS